MHIIALSLPLRAFVASCDSPTQAPQTAPAKPLTGPDFDKLWQAGLRKKTYSPASPASRATSRQPISRRQKPLSNSIWSTAA